MLDVWKSSEMHWLLNSLCWIEAEVFAKFRNKANMPSYSIATSNGLLCLILLKREGSSKGQIVTEDSFETNQIAATGDLTLVIHGKN